MQNTVKQNNQTPCLEPPVGNIATEEPITYNQTKPSFNVQPSVENTTPTDDQIANYLKNQRVAKAQKKQQRFTSLAQSAF